jgi:hypothetical protein
MVHALLLRSIPLSSYMAIHPPFLFGSCISSHWIKTDGPPISSHFYFFLYGPLLYLGENTETEQKTSVLLHLIFFYYSPILRFLFLFREKYRNGGENNRGFSVHFHKPIVHSNSQHQSKQAPQYLGLCLDAHVSISTHMCVEVV